MKVGVPKEIKVLEYRVGMIPSGVKELVNEGHEVFVETNAGMGIGMRIKITLTQVLRFCRHLKKYSISLNL